MRLYYAHQMIDQIPLEVFESPNVEILSIAHTNITHITERIGELKNLKCLYLTGLKLDTFPRSLLKMGLEIENDCCHKEEGIICLNSVTVSDVPPEIFRQGIRAIERHYLQLESENQFGLNFKLNEAKVVIIGSGNAGKTSLVKALTGDNYNPQEPATIGLTIKSKVIQFKNEKWNLNIWDFGGQNVYQAVQTMFITPETLYIIVLDGRSEDSPDFWLQYISTLAANSPILIVINKIDQNENVMINSREYFYKYPMLYPKILKFSSEKNKQHLLDVLENTICEIISLERYKLSFQRIWSKSWANVKDKLQNLPVEYIEYNDFCEICNNEGVIDESDQKIIRDACHNLGVAFYYDCRIMRPDWLISGANYLISIPKHYVKNGWIEIEDFYSFALEKGEIAKNDWRKDVDSIIGLLEENELIYKASNKIFIPSLLSEQPQNNLPLRDNWQEFCVQYPFLPPALIQRFMIRNQNQELIDVWRYGFFWKASDCVECIMEYFDNTITFYLNGHIADVTSERYRIYNELMDLNKKMHISAAKFYLIFRNSNGASTRYQYESLKKLRDMKQFSLPLPEIGSVIDVRSYAGYFQDNGDIQEKIYIKGDLKMAINRFADSFDDSHLVKILFLAANPNQTSQLKLDEEARDIQEMIRKSEYRNVFSFESRWAVRALDILQAINETNPMIVHFSGHGTDRNQLVLQDINGNAHLVSADAIVQTMLSASQFIKLIYFNTCFSIDFAQSIIKHVDFAIGMKDSIGDLAARIFASQFYSALGFGKSVGIAFEQAKAALMLEGIQEENTPCLFCRNGINANDEKFLIKDIM